MSSNTDHHVAIDLATKIVGKWKQTYGWIPIFAAFAAIFMAFLAGANNLPAPVSGFVNEFWMIFRYSDHVQEVM